MWTFLDFHWSSDGQKWILEIKLFPKCRCESIWWTFANFHFSACFATVNLWNCWEQKVLPAPDRVRNDVWAFWVFSLGAPPLNPAPMPRSACGAPPDRKRRLRFGGAGLRGSAFLSIVRLGLSSMVSHWPCVVILGCIAVSLILCLSWT